ncbi:MAG: hypothetical protein ACPGVK_03080 [Halocynthiibacter sp.]
MDFIRPDARAKIAQFREVWAAMAVVVVGFWIFWITFGFVQYLGLALMMLGLLLLWTGFVKARLRILGGAQGVLEVDERQLTWFGPYGGYVISLNEVLKIEVSGTGDPQAAHWVFTDPTQGPISVPMAAKGNESLIDALSLFRGLKYARVQELLQKGTQFREVVWRKAD